MSDAEYLQKIIREAKKNDWRIGLYGLGQLGRDIGMQLLNWLDLEIDFVSDRDAAAVQSYVASQKEVEGISREQLLVLKEDVLVMACVGVTYIEEVCDLLSQNSFLHVITIDDVMAQDFVLEKFYKIENIRSYERPAQKKACALEIVDRLWSNRKIAVYTCVTGGYDEIHEPLVTEENCDYYLISDRVYQDLQVLQQIDIKNFVPSSIVENAQRNRWCKMYGHKIFRDYRYSIYIDGSILLEKKISHYINQTGNIGIALHRHGLRNCAYEEGLRLTASKRGNIDYRGLRTQMLRYLNEGLPREYGLFECGIIVRDHANIRGNSVMEEWFQEYINGEKRDQLSLTYILWKNGIPSSDIGILNGGEDIRKNMDFSLNEKHAAK